MAYSSYSTIPNIVFVGLAVQSTKFW